MIEELKTNRRASALLVAAIGVMLLATALQGCKLEDLVKVDVPKDVAAAIKSEDRISYSDSPAAWDDWQAYVDRESAKFAKSIDKGAEVAGLLRSLSETGLQIGQDAASTLPGGALISAALAGLGGLFLRRPGDANRERLEKEASYRAGLEKGKQLAESTMEVVAAVRRPDASEPSTDA
jgi:hypothetical protein